jgi:hypothetical protein
VSYVILGGVIAASWSIKGHIQSPHPQNFHEDRIVRTAPVREGGIDCQHPIYTSQEYKGTVTPNEPSLESIPTNDSPEWSLRFLVILDYLSVGGSEERRSPPCASTFQIQKGI